MTSAVPELPVLARDQAFETLYRRYVKVVYHYALALLRNPADAEDVAQTTFLNAYRAYQRGIEIEKPQNWLIKIAHNVARTRYARASCRVKEVPLEDYVEQLVVPEADRPDVTDVLRALGRLTFNQRAAIVMRELEGRSYAEIADTIGVSVSAVETLIFRARKSLRLKASALRTLAAVPLPSSLTQFLGGGGLVAGGGAVAGTGLLIKAAVALVAGALATGFAGDHNGPARAAADPSMGFAGEQSAQRGNATEAQQVRKLRTDGARTPGTKEGPGSHASVAATRPGVDIVTVGDGSRQAPGAKPAAPDGGTQSGPVSQVMSQVSDVASSLQPPSLPPAPIDLPPVPPVPAVPAVPPVPAVPSVPPVPPIPLP
jgi:RNA polymerase sigma factor (sigma-70 family)